MKISKPLGKKQCVYSITNTVTGECYIGSTVNLARRWSDHKRDLSALKHTCTPLQEAWVLHGPEAFEMRILKEVDRVEELGVCEHYFMSICQTLYNVRLTPHKPIREFRGSETGFWQHVIKGDGCWLWNGRVTPDGYGLYSLNGVRWRVHRLSYSLLKGNIPTECVLHHVCNNKGCVNPSHLEPVSQSYHMKELTPHNAAAINASKPCCPCGLPYDRIYNGHRHCNACDRRRAKERVPRRRALRKVLRDSR